MSLDQVAAVGRLARAAIGLVYLLPGGHWAARVGREKSMYNALLAGLSVACARGRVPAYGMIRP